LLVREYNIEAPITLRVFNQMIFKMQLGRLQTSQYQVHYIRESATYLSNHLNPKETRRNNMEWQ